MVEKLRLLNDGACPGAYNMAADKALLHSLLEGASPPTLRFYRWTVPTVSTGYFQKFEKEFDLPLIRKKGWEIVRRPTGGRGVLHWKEVTFSLAFKTEGRGLWEIFRTVHEAIGRGLQLAGIPAVVVSADREKLFSGEGRKGHHSAACFASPSRYELTLEGKKLCGTAQKQVRDSILVHGSLPIESTYRELFEVMRFPDEPARQRAYEQAVKKMTSILEGTGQRYEFAGLCSFIIEGFRKEWGAQVTPGQWSCHEKEIIKGALECREKYFD